MATNIVKLFPPFTEGVVLPFKTPAVQHRNRLLHRIIGCWHMKLTRPITHGSETYRACVRCGMRRTFDLTRWSSTGKFYMPGPDRTSMK